MLSLDFWPGHISQGGTGIFIKQNSELWVKKIPFDLVKASWFPVAQEDGGCSSLYWWSGASWHQQVQLLRIWDTVFISILFFLLPNCHFALQVLERVMKILLLLSMFSKLVWWLVPRGISVLQWFFFCCYSLWGILFYLSVLFILFIIEFFFSKTVLSCKNFLYLSMPRPVEEVVTLSPLVRNKLLFWAFNKVQ